VSPSYCPPIYSPIVYSPPVYRSNVYRAPVYYAPPAYRAYECYTPARIVHPPSGYRFSSSLYYSR
jgi:hypothetical protein